MELTKEPTVVKYTTHRGIYTAIVQRRNKYLYLVMVDTYPLELKKIKITSPSYKEETKYMDYFTEYPLIKAAKTMLFIGKARGINESTKTFLENVLTIAGADCTTINLKGF